MPDQTPWILTVYLAAGGWFVSHVVERVQSTPTLEYHTEIAPVGEVHRVSVRISNLTRDKVFEGVEIVLQGERRSQFSAAEIIPVQPAEDGPERPAIAERSVSYILPRMLPGSAYYLTASQLSDEVPNLRISSTLSVIRPTQRSWETTFARNEFVVLLMIGAAALLVLLFGWIASRPRTAKGDAAAPASDPDKMSVPASPSARR